MALQKKTITAPEGVNFGDLGFYSQGGGLPEGDYVFTELNIQMHDGFGEKKGPMRIGVMITLLSLLDLSAEPRKHFYSFGSQADKSFAPDPTGKRLVGVPGGPATTLNNSTNWAIFLQHLYDAGLPQGTFINDVSVLEGTHVHMMSIPEPAERAGFQSQTGDAMADRKPGQISVVTEIKEDGKPWEGTGGIPEAEAAKPAVKGKPVAAKPAAKPAAKAVETEPAGDDEDIKAAALAGLSSYLEANPNGGAKPTVKIAAFKHVKATYGDDVAQGIQEAMYNDDAMLTQLLGELGYKNGILIKPLA